jgi:hypothetical protein
VLADPNNACVVWVRRRRQLSACALLNGSFGIGDPEPRTAAVGRLLSETNDWYRPEAAIHEWPLSGRP